MPPPPQRAPFRPKDQPGGEIFVAEITGSATVTGGVAHSWKMKRPDLASRGYVDDESGFSGTTTVLPAYDPNGATITTGALVFMRLRNWLGLDGGPVYEILGAGGTGGGGGQRLVVVTGVCLTVS